MSSRNKFFLGILCVLAIGAVVTALVILRRPDAVTNPQFWAEDGKVWYAQAYENRWQSLFVPQDGYFQTISRLVALGAQAIPFRAAPAVFNIAALAAQLLPILFLFSRRMDSLIPSGRLRVAAGVWLAVLPNSAELHLNLTSVQWYLACLGIFILVADPPSTKKWKWFDMIALALSGLSGPFAILFLPVAAFRVWKLRDRWSKIYCAILGSSVIVQIVGAIVSFGTRPRPSLALAPRLVLATLHRQVFMGVVLGARGYLAVLQNIPFHFWIFIATAVLSLIVCTYAFWKASWRLRVIMLLGVGVFATALISPAVAPGVPALRALSESYSGVRYWFIPMIAFCGVLIFCVAQRESKIIKIVGALFLCAALSGIIFDFKDAPFVDYHFSEYARQFQNLPSRVTMKIPINPPGWDMNVTKK